MNIYKEMNSSKSYMYLLLFLNFHMNVHMNFPLLVSSCKFNVKCREISQLFVL